jgi:hypothetical protein
MAAARRTRVARSPALRLLLAGEKQQQGRPLGVAAVAVETPPTALPPRRDCPHTPPNRKSRIRALRGASVGPLAHQILELVDDPRRPSRPTRCAAVARLHSACSGPEYASSPST